ncbi:MAG: extracellular solute-binding protein [Firmicutes bacterium]|nr:extracellular solute-binding protein [Bacillota bacterium]
MKRYLAGTFIFAVAVSVLAGCVKTPTASNQDERYTISWTAWQASPIESDARIKKMIEDKLNVNIDIWNIEPTRFEELLNLRLASGEVPDVIRIPQGYAGLNNIVAQGLAAKLDEDMIKKHAPNLYQEYMECDNNFFKKYGLIDGDLYGIPLLQWIRGKYHQAVVYRGDWMKKLGFDKTPETLQEFEEVMYAFAKGDPDGNGKNDTYGLSNIGMDVVYGAFGYLPGSKDREIKWKNKDGQLVYNAIQPEMKDALRVLAKWYADGVIDPEFVTGEKVGAQMAVSFINGRIGFTCEGRWFDWVPELPGRKEVAKLRTGLEKIDKNAADSLMFGVPPVGPAGKSGALQEKLVTDVMYAFSVDLKADAKKMEKVFSVIDKICFESYEGALEAWFGEKGVDWDYDELGIGDSLDDKWTPANASKLGGHTQLVIFKSNKWKEPPAVMEWLKKYKWDENGITDDLYMYLPSSPKYKVDLQKLEDDAYISIITGKKPIDYFDTFVSQWRKEGGDILTQEANRGGNN